MEFVWAFVIGGLVCVAGQLLIDFTKLTPARILTLFVCMGVLLSFLGVFEPFAEFAGAGATTPILGFGHLLFQGAKDAVDADGVIGALTGGLTAAAGGVTATLLVALIVAVCFKPKDQS